MERMMVALKVMLGDPTESRVRAVLSSHPELLTAAGRALADGLALAQSTPEGRAAAEELCLLLKLCAERGMDDGLDAYRAEVAKIRAGDRIGAAREEARRTSFELTTTDEVPAWAEAIGGPVHRSLNECLETMDEQAGRALSDRQARPPVLYRGESGLWVETRSSLARLAEDQELSVDGFRQIMEITESARTFLVLNWGFSEPEASGFLQHYGLPTDWLDLTDDLSVAASFASSLRVGQLGAMALLPTSRLEECGRLLDLSKRATARRPRRQHAWVFSDSAHRNLKDPDAVAALGVRWHIFRLAASDVERYGVDPELLDAHSDPLAGVLQLLIDSGSWERATGARRPSLELDAAEWLAYRLEPAPVMGRVGRDGSSVTLLSADEVAEPFDRAGLQRRNYEAWSGRHGKMPSAEHQAGLEPLLTQDLQALGPGCVIRITSADGLHALAAIDLSETT